MKIKLNNVRLAFPVLFKAEQFQGTGDAMFSASFIFEGKDDPIVQQFDSTSNTWKSVTLRKAIEQVAREKWPKDWQSVMKIADAKDLNCLHDGDLKTTLDGYQGNMYLSSRSKIRPGVFDNVRDPSTGQAREIRGAEEGKPYSGCYVNASVELWAQDNNYGKRINASLSGVQFWRDGDAFAAGRPATAGEFDDIAEGATADDLV